MDSGAFPPANSTIVGAMSILRIGLYKMTKRKLKNSKTPVVFACV